VQERLPAKAGIGAALPCKPAALTHSLPPTPLRPRQAAGDVRYATPGANQDWMALATWRDFQALMKARSGCPEPPGQPDPLQASPGPAASAAQAEASLWPLPPRNKALAAACCNRGLSCAHQHR
jgi:hypothetical protein